MRLFIVVVLAFTGIMYLVLMLPLFHIAAILGIGELPPAPNGPLSTFEIFWQPICAIAYFVAAWHLSIGSKYARISMNIAMAGTLIEALVLNVTIFFASRVTTDFRDGIFFSAGPYPLSKAVGFIAAALAALILLNFYFAKSTTKNN